jgi:hypothetical protein
MLWVLIIKVNSKAGLEHCVAFKKLDWNIAYRISIILHSTTIYMQKKRAVFFPTFQAPQRTLPSTDLCLGLP